MNVHKNIASVTGNTPLMELSRIQKNYGCFASIYAKLEYFNPSGSVKDRAALYMLDEAERCGLLKPGGLIIEPTSGNTGIGLAAFAAVRGYTLILTMPESMSLERRQLLKAYGARIVLTDAASGMSGAIAKAEELVKENPGSFMPAQFDNHANPLAHYQTTGPEIWRDTDGTVDIFVAGVGTGGTLSGTGAYLKEKKPSVKVYAVEPDSSAVLSGSVKGKHGIQGIGAGFIPKNLDTRVYDGVIRVRDADAAEYTRVLAKTEGILAGISSGAALCAAVELARKKENTGRVITVLFPDGGAKYLSAGLFEE
ncbi:cysteine synthase A [Treponema sp. OMZ 840]|uniref:cysteine synthase A n=1 Tax=Treponema sp. OMZ 840 TaxID=244313 RepID=UPI003D8C389D